MKAKVYFKNLSTTVIVMSIFLGLGAIFLMERLVPEMDNILKEHLYPVSSVIEMQEALTLSETRGKQEQYQKNFWKHFEQIKLMSSLEKQNQEILEIESLAASYWDEESVTEESSPLGAALSNRLNNIVKVHLKTMEEKNLNAQRRGLASAWALGILLLASVGVQLFLRANILKFLIDPVEQIVNVLSSYNAGNKMRRCLLQKDTVEDVKQAGALINGVLDQLSVLQPNKTLPRKRK